MQTGSRSGVVNTARRSAELALLRQIAAKLCLAQRVYRMFLVDPKLLKLELLKEIRQRPAAS